MEDFKSKLKCEELDYFFEAIRALKTGEECYRFFEDILTVTEIKALSQRLQVAKMLKEKKTYVEIADLTGASTATISRVNRALTYGCDGYNLILDRLKK